MEENNDTFLTSIARRIQDGEFDEYLKIPLMTRKLMFAAIKHKINKRVSIGGSAILIDAEIRDAIEMSKETSAYTFKVLIESGILEKTEEGYQLSRKGKIAMRESIKP